MTRTILSNLAVLAITTSHAAAGATGHIAAEGTYYSADTEVFGAELDAQGALYGLAGTVRNRYDPLVAKIEGRLQTGNIGYEVNDVESTDGANLGEIRGLIGASTGSVADVYTGVGARYLDADMPVDGSRTNRMVYVPVGLMGSGEWMGGWRVHTEIEAGLVVWNEEDLEATVGGRTLDGEFERNGGWQARLTMAFRKGPLVLAPFIRQFGLDKTSYDNVGGSAIRIEPIDVTEAGLRVGYGF